MPKNKALNALRRSSAEVLLHTAAMHLFFLKQQTAYEKPKQLEFRHVLFRSRALARTRTQHSTLCTSARLHARARIGKLRGALRSEERRVGKECRSRGSLYE